MILPKFGGGVGWGEFSQIGTNWELEKNEPVEEPQHVFAQNKLL